MQTKSKGPRYGNKSPVFEKDGRIYRITLNKPLLRNSIDLSDIEKIHEYLEKIKQDPETGVLVLSAIGNTFSAGFDLQLLSNASELASKSEAVKLAFGELCDRIEALPMPTICAISGNIYGGAADLILAFDFRIGVDGIVLKMPASSLGIQYYPMGLRRFVTRLGLSTTKRVVLAGETLTAQELLRTGFVDEILPPAEFDDRIAVMESLLSQSKPIAYSGMKARLHEIANGNFDEEAGRRAFLDSLESAEFAEGMAEWRRRRARMSITSGPSAHTKNS